MSPITYISPRIGNAIAEQAREAVMTVETLRQETASERSRLERLLEDLRREAKDEGAKLEGASRSLREELQSTRSELHQEKVRSTEGVYGGRMIAL